MDDDEDDKSTSTKSNSSEMVNDDDDKSVSTSIPTSTKSDSSEMIEDDDDRSNSTSTKDDCSEMVEDDDNRSLSTSTRSDSSVPSHTSSPVKESLKACNASLASDGEKTSWALSDTSLPSGDLDYPKRCRIDMDLSTISQNRSQNERVDEWIQGWFHPDVDQHENSVVQSNEGEAIAIEHGIEGTREPLIEDGNI